MDENNFADGMPDGPYLEDNNESNSFWGKLISFFRDDSPEAKKKKLLKDIEKILKKHKYKFLNVKTEEALPAIAKFYYQIYRVTGIPASIISGQENSPALKYLFIDSVLSEKQRILINRLQKDSIEKRLKDNSTEVENIKKELGVLLKSIDEEQQGNINRLYRQYLIFLRLLKFDYYFLLRKFDSGFTEMDFKYKPAFQAISCDYIIDDIIDTESLFPLLLRYDSWDEVFEILKVFKGQDILSREDWNKLMKIIASIHQSEIFNYIIKLTTKNPFYSSSISEQGENICDDYFSRLKTAVEMIIQKVAIEKKNTRRDALLNQIFATTAVSRMKNYTEANNGVYKSKMLGGFLYIDIMNYLKAFMLDYVKKDLMRIVNFLVVKAEWKINTYSKEMSDTMEELIAISDRIMQFDQSLAADEDVGTKMNIYLKRMTSDPKYKTEIKKLLHDINSKVVVISQDTYRNLTAIAQILVNILPELGDPPKMSMIINSEFVKNSYGNDIIGYIKAIYKQIYNFLSLIKIMFEK